MDEGGVLRSGSRLGKEISALLAYVALAVGATWPLALVLSRGLGREAGADPFFVAAMLEWAYTRLPSGLSGFWDPPFFFPLESIASYSDPLLGLQIFYAPFRLLTGHPVTAFNLTFLAELALCGYGAFCLARHVTGDVPGSLVAGALFELLPAKVPHLDHLHIISLGFVPLTLLAVHRMLERPGGLRAVAVGAAYATAFLTSVYNGVYLGVLVVPFALAVLPRRRGAVRGLVACGGALAITAALLLWLHLPLVRTQEERGLVRSIEENVVLSARPMDYLSPFRGTLASRVRSVTHPPESYDERYCYLGIVPMALGSAALLRFRRVPASVRSYLLLVGITLVLSLGPYLVVGGHEPVRIPLPYLLLHRYVPGFDALRVPARLCLFVGLLLVPPAAHVASRLLRPVSGSRLPAALAGAALVALHGLDGWPAPRPPLPYPWREPDPVYEHLARERRPSALVEIPASDPDNARAMLQAVRHGRPVVNGYTSHRIRSHTWIFRHLTEFPSRPMIAALDSLRDGATRVRHVIWRRAPGSEEAFARARAEWRTFPAVSLVADLGDTLVFALRPLDELLAPGGSRPNERSWVPLPLDRFEVTAPLASLRDDVIHLSRPGGLRRMLPFRRGPVRLRISVAARADDASLPPLRLRAFLDEVPILAWDVPWGNPQVVETAPLEVLVPARYELRLELEPTGPLGRRPPMSVVVTCVEIAAR